MRPLTQSAADKEIGRRNGTVAAAIRRGELQGHVMPGGKRKVVFPDELEAWVRSWPAEEKRRPSQL